MTTKPVTAGTDGSEDSLRAVEWAALEALARRAPLRVVAALAGAWNPRVRGFQAPGPGARGTCRRALDDAVARAGEIAPGVVIRADLLDGPPALTVTSTGDEARMLVVGARGAGGFPAMLLGSVSRYAAMHAVCPVVVVREETGAVHREVVAGVGGSHDTDAVLAHAFDLAARRHATVAAVRCWGPFPWTGEPERLDRAAAAGQALARHLDPWREKYPDVPVRQDIVSGHPGRILAWYSARADLVVIGRNPQRGTALVVGAVPHSLLGHAHGPVAVIPARS